VKYDAGFFVNFSSSSVSIEALLEAVRPEREDLK